MSKPDLDMLRRWEGREETAEDILSLAPVRALAATLDNEPAQHVEGSLLPPLYHWLYFLQPVRWSELARDGHAKKGGFMPPVPFPRRVFAGARVDYLGDLRVGERVRRVSTIRSVRYKDGRSGPIVFVTVSHRVSNDDGVQLEEEQDIAYRPAEAPTAGPVEPAVPGWDFVREVEPDEPLLFRFSALTFNAHRIHYDLPYTISEGYPALVVHGPLTAVLLADLVARECGRPRLRHFGFRAKRILSLGDSLRLTGKRVDGAIELAAIGGEGGEALCARAVFR